MHGSQVPSARVKELGGPFCFSRLGHSTGFVGCQLLLSVLLPNMDLEDKIPLNRRDPLAGVGGYACGHVILGASSERFHTPVANTRSGSCEQRGQKWQAK